MKINLWRFASMFLSAALLLSVSCSKEDPEPNPKPGPDTETPGDEANFPETEFNGDITAQADVEVLKFTPSHDWTATFSDDTNQGVFHFIDGVQHVATVSGTAGSLATIKVGVLDYAHSQDIVAKVILKMNGEERQIATITYGAVIKDVKYYTATLIESPEEEGIFFWEQEGTSIKWTELDPEDPDTKINFAYNYQTGDYVCKIKVEANFETSIAGTYPNWIDADSTLPTDEESKGISLVYNLAVSSQMPYEGAEDTITFNDVSSSAVAQLHTFTIVLPSSEHIHYAFDTWYGNDNNIRFLEDGESRNVTAIGVGEDWLLYQVSKNGQYYFAGDDDVDWIQVGISDWDSTLSPLQERTLTITVAENSNDIRYGQIIALPKDVFEAASTLAGGTTSPSEVLFNTEGDDFRTLSDGTNLADYVIFSFWQEASSETWGVLAPANHDEGATFEKLTDDSDPDYAIIKEKLGLDIPSYRLTYNYIANPAVHDPIYLKVKDQHIAGIYPQYYDEQGNYVIARDIYYAPTDFGEYGAYPYIMLSEPGKKYLVVLGYADDTDVPKDEDDENDDDDDDDDDDEIKDSWVARDAFAAVWVITTPDAK